MSIIEDFKSVTQAPNALIMVKYLEMSDIIK